MLSQRWWRARSPAPGASSARAGTALTHARLSEELIFLLRSTRPFQAAPPRKFGLRQRRLCGQRRQPCTAASSSKRFSARLAQRPRIADRHGVETTTPRARLRARGSLQPTAQREMSAPRAGNNGGLKFEASCL